MFGNWATGKVRMVRAPTNTITIEITIATIGRSMKNFDIDLPPFRFRGKWLGAYLHPRAHLLSSLYNDGFARLQAFGNNPVLTDTVAHGDRANVHFAVPVHDGYLVPPL